MSSHRQHQKSPDTKTLSKPEPSQRPRVPDMALAALSVENPPASVAAALHEHPEPEEGSGPTDPGLVPDPAPEMQATEAAPNPKSLDQPSAPQKKPAADDGEKKVFSITLPVKTLKLLALVGRMEGRSVSDLITEAIYAADLRGRAKKALAQLAEEIDGE
jgi:hypothetical protein